MSGEEGALAPETDAVYCVQDNASLGPRCSGCPGCPPSVFPHGPDAEIVPGGPDAGLSGHPRSGSYIGDREVCS